MGKQNIKEELEEMVREKINGVAISVRGRMQQLQDGMNRDPVITAAHDCIVCKMLSQSAFYTWFPVQFTIGKCFVISVSFCDEKQRKVDGFYLQWNFRVEIVQCFDAI